MLKIHAYGPGRYVMEVSGGKVHMLNLASLKWNLKNVFMLTGEEVLSIVVSLEIVQSVEVDLKEAA